MTARIKDIDYKKYGFTTINSINPYRIIGEKAYILIDGRGTIASCDKQMWYLKLCFFPWHSSHRTDILKELRKAYPQTKVMGADGKLHSKDMQSIIFGDLRLPGYVIDHIDGNHFNNEGFNLRQCLPGENNRNRHTDEELKHLNITDEMFRIK